MKKFKKSSRGHELIILFLFITFNFSLLTFHSALGGSLSYAESISDIKIEALQLPVKERWGRDPFIRYEDRLSKEKQAKEELPLDIKVDGIISDGGKAMAIINGGFYRKQERVNDFLIVGIDKDKVLLEKNGKRFYLGIEKFAIEGSQKGGKK